MNFISQLISKLTSQENLHGEWTTEDGSGFSMIMGSWIVFKKDGTGSYESWNNGGEEDGYLFKGDFLWKKTDDLQIKIQESNKPDEIVNYQFKNIQNRIELSNSDNKDQSELEQFWNFGQVLFRLKN